MIELSQTRDGGKEDGMEKMGEACFMGNGFKEGQEEDGTAAATAAAGGGAGEGKQVQFPSPPSNFMDNISGEFALVINGHSLV